MFCIASHEEENIGGEGGGEREGEGDLVGLVEGELLCVLVGLVEEVLLCVLVGLVELLLLLLLVLDGPDTVEVGHITAEPVWYRDVRNSLIKCTNTQKIFLIP